VNGGGDGGGDNDEIWTVGFIAGEWRKVAPSPSFIQKKTFCLQLFLSDGHKIEPSQRKQKKVFNHVFNQWPSGGKNIEPSPIILFILNPLENQTFIYI
jgi:hypothetical protein